MKRKNKRTIDPDRRYTKGDWPKDRPENPCKVFRITSVEGLEQQIQDALDAAGGPKHFKAIWLPDQPEYDLKADYIEGVPIKFTQYDRGGAQGIWLEVIGET